MKKTLTIILAVTMILTVTATAFASANSGGKITGMAGNLSMGYTGAGDTGGSYLDEVYPQDKRVAYIDLYDTMFTWDSHQPVEEPQPLTSAQIRSARLDVRASNMRVLDSVSVNASKSRIEVKFKTEHVSVKELDFDFDITLSIDGRQQRDYSMNFSGTFANPVMEAGKHDEYADISDGSVLDPQESIRNIELDLGNGVTVTRNLVKGRKVYGKATFTPDRQAEDVMNEHRDIEHVVILKTVDLKASGKIVKIEGGYHVYDEKLNYLGKSGDMLPFSDRYYLAGKKLVITTVEEDTAPVDTAAVPDAELVPTQPEFIPGVMDYPQNVNDNPMTGR